MPSDFENKFGKPDLMAVFTNIRSHKMENSAKRKSKKRDIPAARIHNTSA